MVAIHVIAAIIVTIVDRVIGFYSNVKFCHIR